MCLGRAFIFALVSIVSIGFVESYTANDLNAHLTTTFTDYSSRVRPVSDQSSAVSVTLDLYLVGINDFNNAEQKLETTAYLDISWTDAVLQSKWANAGIDSVLVTQSSLWLPDVALQNSVESMAGLGDKSLKVRVLKDGTVTWRPFQVFESSCAIDVTYFPFDKTVCELKFVMWSNPITHVRVVQGSQGLNMDSYTENSEWTIYSSVATDYNTATTSGVIFTVNMKRKPLFYLLNIFFPVIMLALLNAFVFALPVTSGERTGLSVTAFLAFAVFLTIISAELPKNSERISMFAAYVFLMTFLSSLIAMVTISEIRLARRSLDQPIPGCLLSVTRAVRRLRCGVPCRRKKGHIRGIAIEELKRRLAEDISWGDTVDALDFVFFWIFFMIIVIVTVLCLLLAALSA